MADTQVPRRPDSDLSNLVEEGGKQQDYSRPLRRSVLGWFRPEYKKAVHTNNGETDANPDSHR